MRFKFFWMKPIARLMILLFCSNILISCGGGDWPDITTDNYSNLIESAQVYFGDTTLINTSQETYIASVKNAGEINASFYGYVSQGNINSITKSYTWSKDESNGVITFYDTNSLPVKIYCIKSGYYVDIIWSSSSATFNFYNQNSALISTKIITLNSNGQVILSGPDGVVVFDEMTKANSADIQRAQKVFVPASDSPDSESFNQLNEFFKTNDEQSLNDFARNLLKKVTDGMVTAGGLYIGAALLVGVPIGLPATVFVAGLVMRTLISDKVTQYAYENTINPNSDPMWFSTVARNPDSIPDVTTYNECDDGSVSTDVSCQGELPTTYDPPATYDPPTCSGGQILVGYTCQCPSGQSLNNAGVCQPYSTPQPVDCQVSTWSEWSTCSAACGGGQTTRQRQIITQPQNGGQECPVLTETTTCNQSQCIFGVTGYWSGTANIPAVAGCPARSATRSFSLNEDSNGNLTGDQGTYSLDPGSNRIGYSLKINYTSSVGGQISTTWSWDGIDTINGEYPTYCSDGGNILGTGIATFTATRQ